ncbi:MAG: C69 family dipeptidase [Synergistaceae bacterium]|nr:C69 family dipeptidase [Synergistaceae bacterium]
MTTRKFILSLIAIFIVLALTGSTALACFTIIVGKDASSTKKVIVGHNEDDGSRAVYRHALVPAATWANGTKIPAETHPAARAPKSDDIPQVPSTFGYYWSEGRETRVGTNVGMSAADAFMNENGVFVATNNNGNAQVPKGGFEKQGIIFILRRAIAERATNSRHGVMIAAELLRDYGYGQSRAYTISDADEAWMLQVTQGNQYVARRVKDDEIVLMPNMFTIRNIDFSNAKEEAPEIMANDTFIWSKYLVQHAIDNGFYKPSDPDDKLYSDFDFAFCYQQKFDSNNAPSTWNTPRSTLRLSYGISIMSGKEWRTDNTDVIPNHPETGYPFSIKPAKVSGNSIYNGTASPELIKRVLRTHFEGSIDDPLEERIALLGANPHDTTIRRTCDQTTDESTVVEFGETPALTTLWVAFGRPCEQPYIPLHVMGINSLPEKLKQMENPAKEMAEHFIGKTELSAYIENDAWWTIRSMQNMLDLVYIDAIEGHTKWLLAKDAELKTANASAIAFAKSLSDKTQQRAFLTDWDNELFNSVLDSIIEVKNGLNPVEITVESNTIEKSKAANSNELIKFEFRMNKACKPNVATMWMGVGLTNTRTQGWIQPESVRNVKEDLWEAEFYVKELIGENSFATVGFIDFWLGGKDMMGKSFGGSVILDIK